MMHYACISVLWVSLTVCLGQSFEDQLNSQFQGVSPECQKALVTCALPVVMPYTMASDPSQALETARNIRLGEHCRKTRKSFVCFRGLIGEDQCSDLDPMMTAGWKRVADPLIDEAWSYICRTEFKKFNIHYRCLLTEEVIISIQRSCSLTVRDPEIIECYGRVIKEECGSTASEITKGLFLTVGERFKAIQKDLGIGQDEEDREDGDDEQKQQSTFPENMYARHLAIIKKLLKRK